MTSKTSSASTVEKTVMQLPDTPLYQNAFTLVFQNLAPAIFAHSFRVYLHARNLLAKETAARSLPDTFFRNDKVDDTLLFVAAIFHDMGTSEQCNGPHRFEIAGADAACAHLQACGVDDERDLQRVWTAIALHSTGGGIAERLDPLTRLLRLAVKIDFSRGPGSVREQYGAEEYAEEIERELPRDDVEKVLSDAVVKQAVELVAPDVQADRLTWLDFEKFPKASWPGTLLRAHLENPGYDGVNPAF
jgi:HD superfamily phosphodiesterase